MSTVISWGLSDLENLKLRLDGVKVTEVFTSDGLYHAAEFASKKNSTAVVLRMEKIDDALLDVLERFVGDHVNIPLIVELPTADSDLITQAYEIGATHVTVGRIQCAAQLGLLKDIPPVIQPCDAQAVLAWIH